MTLLVHGAAVNRQCHGRTYHRGHGSGRCGPQTVYARPLFRTFLTEPTASVVTQFGSMLERSQAHERALPRQSRSTRARMPTRSYAEPWNGEACWCWGASRRPS
jgi:hypothetical protein